MEENNKNEYLVGNNIPTWKDGTAQTITFIVTEDCNLRCKYCYITHKASNKKMDFEIAKRFIDYVLNADIERTDAVIIEFIGGEPLLEIDVITQICNYFKEITYLKNDSWFWNYRINISTNGINYLEDGVQKFILDNQGKLNIGFSIDGNKKKHDLQRVFPDSTGSYEAVMKNVPLYLKQFHASTKMTFASDDLPLLKDSVISLYNNGIERIAANVVFENVWKEKDDIVFEEQLKELADYIIENGLYNSFYCTLFFDGIGQTANEDFMNKTSCGAGKMMAVDPDGKIFPCLRYKEYSLNHKQEWVLGTIGKGIDMDKVRPFVAVTAYLQSDDECRRCEVKAGCSYCQGFNYDSAETDTNFTRAKFICKMHKARVRANDYYFSLLYNRYGIERKNFDYSKMKKMYILLSDDHFTFCTYENNKKDNVFMGINELEKALEFCRHEFFRPILVHSSQTMSYLKAEFLEKYRVLHMISASFYVQTKYLKECKYIFDKENYEIQIDRILQDCILNVEMNDIGNLSKYVLELFKKVNRIELNINNLGPEFSEDIYKEQLYIIMNYLVEFGKEKAINIISDVLTLKEHNNCKAGDRTFCIAPNNYIYICPAFFHNNEDMYVGDINNGIYQNRDGKLYKAEFQPICGVCDAKHCCNCVDINKKYTKEVNISPAFQCRKSYIEKEVSREYQILTQKNMENKIEKSRYKDPIEKYFSITGVSSGYYKCKNNNDDKEN